MRKLLAPMVLLTACGTAGTGGNSSATSSSSGGAGNPSVQLGGGQSQFQPLSEGQDMELIFGAQGGWHVEVTARLCDLDPEGLVLAYEAFREGESTVLSFPATYGLNATRVVRDGEWLARLGDRAVLDISSPSDVVGTRLRLRVTARPADGSGPFTDEHIVTVVDNAP